MEASNLLLIVNLFISATLNSLFLFPNLLLQKAKSLISAPAPTLPTKPVVTPEIYGEALRATPGTIVGGALRAVGRAADIASGFWSGLFK